MYCTVYKSSKKQETYLYLAAKDVFTGVPQPLLDVLGTPTPVLHLELHPGRRLAQAEVGEVMHQLRQQGWYLQMPPSKEERQPH